MPVVPLMLLTFGLFSFGGFTEKQAKLTQS